MNSRRKGASTEQNGLCSPYLSHPTREGAAQSAILSPSRRGRTKENLTHIFGHYPLSRTLPNRLHTAEQHRFPGVKRARTAKKWCTVECTTFSYCVCCPILFGRRDICFSRQRTFPLRTTEMCHSPTDWVQRTTFCRKPSEVSRRKTPCKGAKSSCTSEPVATKLRKVLPAAEYKRTRAPGCTPRNTKVDPTHCK